MIDNTLLINNVDEIVCCPSLYCIDSIMAIEAVGIDIVMTVSCNTAAGKSSSNAIPQIASGTSIFFEKTIAKTVLLMTTLYKNRIIPDANNATPAVDLPSKVKESIIAFGSLMSNNTNKRPNKGAHTTGSFNAFNRFEKKLFDEFVF